jgi:hypothetical protein
MGQPWTIELAKSTQYVGSFYYFDDGDATGKVLFQGAELIFLLWICITGCMLKTLPLSMRRFLIASQGFLSGTGWLLD